MILTGHLYAKPPPEIPLFQGRKVEYTIENREGGRPVLDFRMDTFLEVCRCRNYTRAAEHLNITQPAVTQHIQYLQNYYGARLFVYHNK